MSEKLSADSESPRAANVPETDSSRKDDPSKIETEIADNRAISSLEVPREQHSFSEDKLHDSETGKADATYQAVTIDDTASLKKIENECQVRSEARREIAVEASAETGDSCTGDDGKQVGTGAVPSLMDRADDGTRRKMHKMQRRNNPRNIPHNSSAPVSTNRRSVTSALPSTNLSASCEPGNGLMLATVARPAPEPAFKAAPRPARAPPQAGAVFCAHRTNPEVQPSFPEQQNSGKSVWSASLGSNASRSVPNSTNRIATLDTDHSNRSLSNQELDRETQELAASSIEHESMSQSGGPCISAEVVPETQLDLERAIRDRVRKDLFLSTSLRKDIMKDAPVAVVVPESTNSRHSPEKIEEGDEESMPGASTTQNFRQGSAPLQSEEKSQWFKGGMIVAILVGILLIVIIILASTGVFSASDSNSNGFSSTIDTSSLHTIEIDHQYDETFALANIPETICYDRLPYLGFSDSDAGYIPACPPQPLGSPATNLLQQSRLWNFPEAEISIGNAGEAKRDLLKGNFTYGNLITFLPHEEELFIVTLSGRQILSLLERVVQTIANDLELADLHQDPLDGAYPYAAGLRYNVNMSESFPHRISTVEVSRGLKESWTALNPNSSYTIVTNLYLKNGGDGYHELSTVTGAGTGITSQSAFIEYCLNQEVLLNPPPETYSTQSFHFEPGMYDSWNV